jgi:hypothetical protein
MMFVLAMRTLVNTTATKAMRNPADVPLMMLGGCDRERNGEMVVALIPAVHDLHGQRDDDPAHHDAKRRAHHCSRRAVESTFDGELRGHPASPHADCPHDPELAPALLREHHIDVHDQQYAGDDAEAADEEEERAERRARLVGTVEHHLLRGPDPRTGGG